MERPNQNTKGIRLGSSRQGTLWQTDDKEEPKAFPSMLGAFGPINSPGPWHRKRRFQVIPARSWPTHLGAFSSGLPPLRLLPGGARKGCSRESPHSPAASAEGQSWPPWGTRREPVPERREQPNGPASASAPAPPVGAAAPPASAS